MSETFGIKALGWEWVWCEGRESLSGVRLVIRGRAINTENKKIKEKRG
jgi:hypothetical protein